MKIEIFNTLQAVLDVGSLAGAAKNLHLTPSAVSMQMKQLEAYVGRQLFDRSGLEVRPLPAAYELSELLHGMLSRLDAFRRQPSFQVEGHVQLGMLESMLPVVLPELLKRLKTRYPLLHLQTRRGKSIELTNAVKAGDLDAAVVAQPERGLSRLHWQPLIKRGLTLMVPPQERERSLSALLKRYEWIRYDRNTISGAMAAKYIQQRFGGKPAGDLEFDSVRAIAPLVSAGLGISLVPLMEPAICTLYPVTVIALRDAPVLQFSLVTRKTDIESRQLLALQEILLAATRAAERDTASDMP
ncbi:LysR family transcriptional regulator [Caballeronia sp. LZ065]|uniref:LysR family transcriptional regulator n=1 Tax=Caballeronia sp. LZ065 TaxID=3038571 RepID=UPI0028624102|nr:LysR family transcriptional regulator [Caballeronia sp. LZ065]MDR5781345.1 LysR family transcriptional regulator [Caballeronia sp. LZ065]